jgi:hypothetical protein
MAQRNCASVRTRARLTRLDNGREAVGRAARSRHDVIHRRLVRVVVHAVHHVQHGLRVLHRRRDEHLAHLAGVEVRRQRGTREEHARALQHERNPRRRVRGRQRGRLLGAAVRHAQLAPRPGRVAQHDDVALRARRVRPRAVHAVILHQVRRALRRTQIVQVHQLEHLGQLERNPQRQAAWSTALRQGLRLECRRSAQGAPMRPQPLRATLTGAIAVGCAQRGLTVHER